MFSAVIFDFDGVLFDSEPLHLKACNEVFKNFNIFIDEKIYFEKFSGLSDKELFPIVLAENNYPETTHAFLTNLLEKKMAAYKKIISAHSTLNSRIGMIDLLNAFSSTNKKLAICSNALREEIDVVLSRLEQGSIAKFFNTITTIEQVTKGKPDPEGYLQTSQKLNVNPHECIVLEDTPNGIKAAKAAGMRVIGLTGTHERHYLQAADFVIEHLSEIPKLLFENIS